MKAQRTKQKLNKQYMDNEKAVGASTRKRIGVAAHATPIPSLILPAECGCWLIAFASLSGVFGAGCVVDDELH